MYLFQSHLSFHMHSKLKCGKALFIFILLSFSTYTEHYFNKQGVPFLFSSSLHEQYLPCSGMHSIVQVFAVLIFAGIFSTFFQVA